MTSLAVGMNQSSNKPRILRITRPYESVEDYIQSEGWTISTKRMILLDQPRFDRDTIVRFELSLQNGEKLIRAEAKVVGYQTATPDKPGGPKVRFKRFGGTTKAFIQQVVAEHGPGPGLETLYPAARGSDPGDAPISEAPPHSLNFSFPAEPSAPLLAGGVTASDAAPSASSRGTDPSDLQQFRLGAMPPAPLSLHSPSALHSSSSAPSARSSQIGAVGASERERLRGLLDRTGNAAVAKPVDREALLARLRERARGVSEPPGAPG